MTYLARAVQAAIRSKVVTAASVASFVFVIAGWIWSYRELRGIKGPLIIHYTNAQGIDRIGTTADLAQIALTGIAVVAINTAVAFVVERRDRFFGKLLMCGTLALSVLLFLGFWAIISVN